MGKTRRRRPLRVCLTLARQGSIGAFSQSSFTHNKKMAHTGSALAVPQTGRYFKITHIIPVNEGYRRVVLPFNLRSPK